MCGRAHAHVNKFYFSFFRESIQGKTLSEEEEMAAELEELFPSASVDDFGDLQQAATLEQIPERRNTQEESVVGVVSQEIMDYVCQLHAHIVQSYTSTAWFIPTGIRSPNLTPNFIKPLFERSVYILR